MPAPLLARFFAYCVDRFVLFIPQVILIATVGWVAALLLEVVYFVFTEASSRGASVGKMALGIRVEDAASETILSPSRAFIRCVTKAFGIALFFLGLIPALWNPRARMAHDYAAGSVVVVDVKMHEIRRQRKRLKA